MLALMCQVCVNERSLLCFAATQLATEAQKQRGIMGQCLC
jgi:hypothetical protein